jgi:large subunit ribosomal protein L24
MKVVKNDTVMVVTGNFKGKKGKVLKVFPKEERVIIEGVNFIKRHTRKSQKNPRGGIIEREAPIHASNVKIVCSKCGKPARIGRIVLDNKKRVRACKNCGEMLAVSA